MFHGGVPELNPKDSETEKWKRSMPQEASCLEKDPESAIVMVAILIIRRVIFTNYQLSRY